MHRVLEAIKLDQILKDEFNISGDNPGNNLLLSEHGINLDTANDGTTSAPKQAKVEIFQAKDASGTDSKPIPEAQAGIALNHKVTELTITFDGILDTESLTINGVTFTAHKNKTIESENRFSVLGNNAANAAEFVKCVNDSNHGLPDIIASNQSEVVRLKAQKDIGITATSRTSHLKIAEAKARSFLDIENLNLDIENGFTHIIVKCTNDAKTHIAVTPVNGPLQK